MVSHSIARAAALREPRHARPRRILSLARAACHTPAMGAPNIPLSAIQTVAENRIREAMAEGAFDNLPGQGKPIPDIDEPYDELWWFKRWLRRENLREALAEGLKRLRPAAASARAPRE